MEPLRWKGTVHTVLRSVHHPIPLRRVINPPFGWSESDVLNAMHFVRRETYCGGRLTVENGRPGPQVRAQFRQWIKDGVLNVSSEQARADRARGERLRKYYVRLQEELIFAEGPFEWKYGHENTVS